MRDAEGGTSWVSATEEVGGTANCIGGNCKAELPDAAKAPYLPVQDRDPANPIQSALPTPTTSQTIHLAHQQRG